MARAARRFAAASAFIAAIVLTAAAGCTTPLPTPKLGPHVGDEPVIVPYPPPPGRVEIVPPPPPAQPDAVWVDGEWDWRGRRWVWESGRWEVPYPGAYYAASTTVRLSDGTLAWFAGDWHFPGAKPR